MKDLNKFKVVIFSLNEPTSELSVHCFKKLGFTDIQVIDGQGTFVEKFILFSKLVNNTDNGYYIRSDSDRFVFDGMVDLVNNIDVDYNHFEGYGFDYFMNKFRGATPQIYHRDVLMKLFNNNNLITDVPKPENYFCKNAKVKFKSHKIFTNLHDYYQKPSKVCNTFLNRMIRDGIIHYDLNYINQLPQHYIEAFKVAQMCFKRRKFTPDMNYQNFDFLDEGFNQDISDLDKVYYETRKIYQKIYGNEIK